MLEIKPDRTGLAERLREAREYLGLSQDDVATKLGLTRPAISNIENGSRKVSATELDAFARLYGKTLDYLVSGTEGETPKIAFLAKAAKDLTQNDLRELAQFAEFLRNRPKSGRA